MRCLGPNRFRMPFHEAAVRPQKRFQHVRDQRRYVGGLIDLGIFRGIEIERVLQRPRQCDRGTDRFELRQRAKFQVLHFSTQALDSMSHRRLNETNQAGARVSTMVRHVARSDNLHTSEAIDGVPLKR